MSLLDGGSLDVSKVIAGEDKLEKKVKKLEDTANALLETLQKLDKADSKVEIDVELNTELTAKEKKSLENKAKQSASVFNKAYEEEIARMKKEHSNISSDLFIVQDSKNVFRKKSKSKMRDTLRSQYDGAIDGNNGADKRFVERYVTVKNAFKEEDFNKNFYKGEWDEMTQAFNDLIKNNKELAILAEEVNLVYKEQTEWIERQKELRKQLAKPISSTPSVPANQNPVLSGNQTEVLSGTDSAIKVQEQIQEELKETRAEAEKTSAKIEDVIYHAGIVSKLNKAEGNGQFTGGGRDTGYYGTGHYFVDHATKHELDNTDYSKKPYTSVDISYYDNLFKATTDEIADRLHAFLKDLTNFTFGHESNDINELYADFVKVFGNSVMSIAEFDAKMQELTAYMKSSSLGDRHDSVSTQFMKSLGYGGVDTRGTHRADTRYGTVIYDLKEESILQANITDELQKQGDMLERINYQKGEVFDKSEDDRIQAIFDKEAHGKRVTEEAQKLYDVSTIRQYESELDEIDEKMRKNNDIIYDCESAIAGVDREAKRFFKDMDDLGFEVSDQEVEDWKKDSIKSYSARVEELNKENELLAQQRAELEQNLSVEYQSYNLAIKKAETIVDGKEGNKTPLSSPTPDKTAESVEEKAKEIDAANEQIESSNEEVEQSEKEVAQATEEGRKKASDSAKKEAGEIVEANKKEIASNEEVAKSRRQKYNISPKENIPHITSAIPVQNPLNTETSATGMNNEASTADTVAKSMDKASESKKKFAKANKNVEESAKASEKALKAEANAAEEVNDSVDNEKASKQNEKAAKAYDNLVSKGKEYYKLLSKFSAGIELDANEARKLEELSKEFYNAANGADKFARAVDELGNNIGSKQSNNDYDFAKSRYLQDSAQAYLDYVKADVNKSADKFVQGTANKRALQFVDEYKSKINELDNAIKNLKGLQDKGIDIVSSEELAEVSRLQSQILELEKELRKMKNNKEYQVLDVREANKNIEEIYKILNKNTRMPKELKELFEALRQKYQLAIDTGASQKDLEGINKELSELKVRLQESGKTGKSFFDLIGTKSHHLAAQFFAMYFSLQDLMRLFRQGYQYVAEIDKQMIELEKVSDMSGSRLTQSFEHATEAAKDLGSTISDVISATADWSRLGYGADAAEELAEVAILYKNVGDGIDISTANESLISTLQGFQMEASQAMDIVDAFNEVKLCLLI